MSEWSLFDGSYPGGAYRPCPSPQPPAQFRPPPAPAQARQLQPPTMDKPLPGVRQPTSKGESPRELRNRAEKQRRDIMHQSVTRLASIVPPVSMSTKKVDKTSVLRLSAHYLRAYKHVFGKSIQRGPRFSMEFTRSFLKTMKGFVLTSTYKGLVVVVSPNIQEYLGYSELDLLGQSVYTIVHPEDHQLFKEQLFPRCCKLTSNGELLLPQEPNAAEKVAEALKHEKRAFIIRFKKLTHQRSEAAKYLTCHVEGSFRKSDDAGVYVDNHMQIGRRVRTRGNNPYASGNDIVFISVIRPITETFATESRLEAVRMEYRTRHSIDGSIIQSEHRISLITGYMIHEVTGVNAMNFMHRDDVRWVVVALREMYVNQHLMGESCYRLMTKNGKFIHMRTRGALEVDPVSKEATSFVCTNTMVPEEEGSELIKQMKIKFSLKINNEEPMNDFTKNPQGNENQLISVEDPRQLEQVIYHLVTDLPSPRPEENSPQSKASHPDLSIIPPKREQIKRAIEKSYSVLITLRHSDSKTEKMSQEQSPLGSAQNSPNANSSTSENVDTGLGEIVQQYETAVNGETQTIEPPWIYVDDYTWVHAPSSSSYNPENEYLYVNNFGHPSCEFAQMHNNDFAQSDYDSASYNCLPRPACVCNVLSTSQADNDENGSDACTAAETFVIEIPEASTTTNGINNSYLSTQRSVHTWNTPDFETSPSMDSTSQHGSDAWTTAGPSGIKIPEASTSTNGINNSYLSTQRSVHTSNTPDLKTSPSMDSTSQHGSDAWTTLEQFVIQIPEASTSTNGINNSYLSTQRSAHTSNTPDFETLPWMDSTSQHGLDAWTAEELFLIQIPEVSTSTNGIDNSYLSTQRIMHTSNTPEFETSPRMDSTSQHGSDAWTTAGPSGIKTPEASTSTNGVNNSYLSTQRSMHTSNTPEFETSPWMDSTFQHGSNAWTADKPFFVQIPEASTSTNGINNSYLSTQRSIHTSNTPDFETSPSMDSTSQHSSDTWTAEELFFIQIPEASTSTNGINNSYLSTQRSVHTSDTPDFETSLSMDSTSQHGSDAWTADEPLVIQIPEASTSTNGIDNSYLSTQRSVHTSNTPDFETSSSMDSASQHGSDARTANEPFSVQILEASTSTNGINNSYLSTQRSMHTSNTLDFQTSPSMDSTSQHGSDAWTANEPFSVQIPEASTSTNGIINSYLSTQRSMHTSNTPDFQTSPLMDSTSQHGSDAWTANEPFSVQIPEASTSTNGINNSYLSTQRSMHTSNTPDFQTSPLMDSTSQHGSDAWTANELFSVQIPEASTSTNGINNSCTQRSVHTSNTPDLERSPSMDSMIPEELQQRSSIDDMQQDAEPEQMEMEDYPADEKINGEQQNSPQAVPVEPVAPIANNFIDNNNQYDPYEFVEDEEPI